MIIEFENVSLVRNSRSILRDISFSVAEGQVVFLVGPNGAGKTSLIKCASGLVKGFGGNIRIFDCDVREVGNISSEHLGVMIDSPFGYDYLSPRQNLEVFRRYFGLNKSFVGQTLELVGLHEVADRKLGSLSLGMRQRLSIGLSVLNHPKCIILDEPFSNLDVESRVLIRNLISSLQENSKTTFLISSHDLDEAANLATRVLFLKQGNLNLDLERVDFAEVMIASIQHDHPNKLKIIEIIHESKLLSRLNRLNFEVLLTKPEFISRFKSYSENGGVSIELRKASIEDVYFFNYE